MDEDLHYLEKKRYLTRGDKILLGVLWLVGIPVLLFGFPYFVIAAVVCLLLTFFYLPLRSLWELKTGRCPTDAHGARGLRLTGRLSRPETIRHLHTINSAKPSRPEIEDD